MLRRPGGRVTWPVNLAVVRAVAAIRQFQFVQTTLDTIELRVVVDRPLEPDDEALAVAKARSMLGEDFRIVVRTVDALPRGPGGKYEDFVALLPD